MVTFIFFMKKLKQGIIVLNLTLIVVISWNYWYSDQESNRWNRKINIFGRLWQEIMTENEIINRILNGEKNMFRLLVEKYQGMVFRTCMGFVHNKDDADDLSQEVFVGAYQALHKFKGNSSFSTWLYRIAVNASLNKIRKNRKVFCFSALRIFFWYTKALPSRDCLFGSR